MQALSHLGHRRSNPDSNISSTTSIIKLSFNSTTAKVNSMAVILSTVVRLDMGNTTKEDTVAAMGKEGTETSTDSNTKDTTSSNTHPRPSSKPRARRL